jgi:flagellar biosynthesis/type III secretory pathway chaperone
VQTTAQTTVTGSVTGDLLAVLAAQAEVCDALFALADERRAALAAADTDRLGELVGREQPLVTRMRRLENARVQLIRPWAAQLGMEPERLTITDMRGLVDAEAAAALEHAKDDLVQKIARLGEANDAATDLLRACTDSINASIQHLLQTVQLDPRYASGGNRAAHETTSRLTDFRA